MEIDKHFLCEMISWELLLITSYLKPDNIIRPHTVTIPTDAPTPIHLSTTVNSINILIGWFMGETSALDWDVIC